MVFPSQGLLGRCAHEQTVLGPAAVLGAGDVEGGSSQLEHQVIVIFIKVGENPREVEGVKDGWRERGLGGL